MPDEEKLVEALDEYRGWFLILCRNLSVARTMFWSPPNSTEDSSDQGNHQVGHVPTWGDNVFLTLCDMEFCCTAIEDRYSAVCNRLLEVADPHDGISNSRREDKGCVHASVVWFAQYLLSVVKNHISGLRPVTSVEIHRLSHRFWKVSELRMENRSWVVPLMIENAGQLSSLVRECLPGLASFTELEVPGPAKREMARAMSLRADHVEAGLLSLVERVMEANAQIREYRIFLESEAVGSVTHRNWQEELSSNHGPFGSDNAGRWLFLDATYWRVWLLSRWFNDHADSMPREVRTIMNRFFKQKTYDVVDLRSLTGLDETAYGHINGECRRDLATNPLTHTVSVARLDEGLLTELEEAATRASGAGGGVAALSADTRAPLPHDKTNDMEALDVASDWGNGEAYMSARSIADRFELPYHALRKRLQRLRKEDDSAYIENGERGRRESRFTYQLSSVRGIIADLKKTSIKCPPKKK